MHRRDRVFVAVILTSLALAACSAEPPPAVPAPLEERIETLRFNGTEPLPIVLDRQYDAVLVVRQVTPRVMLY